MEHPGCFKLPTLPVVPERKREIANRFFLSRILKSSFSATCNTFEPKKRTHPEKNLHAASPVGESYVFEKVATDFTCNAGEHAVKKLREVIRLHCDCRWLNGRVKDKTLL